MKKRKRYNNLAGKRRRECHLAALKSLEMRDDDITQETIRWRALYERCKRFASYEKPVD